jgi:hypothetical protein
MEQAAKSLEIAKEAKTKTLEANEIAQKYLKPKPLPLEGEGKGEEAPAVPPLVLYYNLLIFMKNNVYKFVKSNLKIHLKLLFINYFFLM